MIWVFDTTAFLHRAMHAVYGDRTPTVPETDTSFLRAATLMLAKVAESPSCTHMLLAADCDGPSLRIDEYADYKKDRKERAPVLRAQLPKFYRAMEQVGVLGWNRYEADDVIGTLVMPEDVRDVTIVSSDKDLLQFINDERRIQVYDAARLYYYDEALATKKMGVHPRQIPDLIGLIGDTSDNLPGVPGIGPTRAQKLLAENRTLDDLYSDDGLKLAATQVGAKTYKSLVEHRDDAFLSRSLAWPRIYGGECPKLPSLARPTDPSRLRRIAEQW